MDISVKDRNGVILGIGDRVEHFSRKSNDCIMLPEYKGKVVSLDVEHLPLVGVDCGLEFTRRIPYTDLIIVS